MSIRRRPFRVGPVRLLVVETTGVAPTLTEETRHVEAARAQVIEAMTPVGPQVKAKAQTPLRARVARAHKVETGTPFAQAIGKTTLPRPPSPGAGAVLAAVLYAEVARPRVAALVPHTVVLRAAAGEAQDIVVGPEEATGAPPALGTYRPTAAGARPPGLQVRTLPKGVTALGRTPPVAPKPVVLLEVPLPVPSSGAVVGVVAFVVLASTELTFAPGQVGAMLATVGVVLEATTGVTPIATAWGRRQSGAGVAERQGN